MYKRRKKKEENCGIWQCCENSQPANLAVLRNFAGCEISQVANFRNLRIFPGCEILQHCSPYTTSLIAF